LTLATRGSVRTRRIRASPSKRASVARCLAAIAAAPTVGNAHPTGVALLGVTGVALLGVARLTG